MAATFSKFLSFLFDPTYHWAALVLVGFLFVVFDLRGAKRVFGILVLYMAVVLFSPIPYWMIKELEGAEPVVTEWSEKPAVVVLTGGTVEFNTETNQFHWHGRVDRLMVPLRNWMSAESLFIISGQDRPKKTLGHYLSETRSMGKLASEFGIPEQRLVLETEARSTRENAQKVAKILRQKGIDDFYLVTSAFHMRRSVQAFQAEGFTPTPFPVDYLLNGREKGMVPIMGSGSLGYFRVALHEYVGTVYYWILNLFPS